MTGHAKFVLRVLNSLRVKYCVPNKCLVPLGHVGGTSLSELEAAVGKFLARGLRGGMDLKRYRVVIDSLDGDFASEARESQKNGEHLVSGNVTAATWIARTCGMSVSSAADRICVGQQLESLPKVAAALSSGEIGFQSASQLCHLRDWLGEKRDLFNEEEMLGYAREHSVFNLRKLCNAARHVADPDRFFEEAEADYTRRRLHISLMPTACTQWTASSTLSAAPQQRQRSTRCPNGEARKTIGRVGSGRTTRWPKWFTTRWTKASCPGAMASGRTSL